MEKTRSKDPQKVEKEEEEKKEEEEEKMESWSHPDSTGSPALWRPRDVRRALGWASLLQQLRSAMASSEDIARAVGLLDVSKSARLYYALIWRRYELGQLFVSLAEYCIYTSFYLDEDTPSKTLWELLQHICAEIMRKIPTSKEGCAFKHTLDLALAEMMHTDLIPEGLPKLSSNVLLEAKKVFICTMVHCLGYKSGQIESLIAATSDEEKEWAAVLQNLEKRHQEMCNTKSLVNTIHLAAPMLDSILERNYMPCCQQWRKRALTYLLDEKTLDATNIIFSSDSGKWKSCFQKVMNKEDMVKVEQILEQCCLELSSQKWDEVISKLMEPCEHMSCSTDSLDLWCRSNKIQAIELEETDTINVFMTELLEQDKGAWWNIPPILAASTFMKGTRYFSCYAEDLYRHMDTRKHLHTKRGLSDNLFAGDAHERIWCMQLLNSPRAI